MSNIPAARRASGVITEATNRQRAASDPDTSAWVGASAGSGKTKVLTDRMLRLLLPREDGRPGTSPDKILALTFTKAGANEMAIRLSRRLSGWAVVEEEKLAKDMEENLFGRVPTPAEIEAARKIFASVVDTPGGLKIMTIHSFCQSILGRFPVESGLNPGFKPLEEGRAQELLKGARNKVLSAAGIKTTSPINLAIANISAVMNEEQFDAALSSIISERNQVRQILRKSFGIEGLYTNICKQFGIQENLSEEAVLSDFCRDTNSSDMREVCNILSAAKADDQKKAAFMQDFLALEEGARTQFYKDYKRGFLSSNGSPYSKLATKDVLASNPHIESILRNETERVLELEEKLRLIACANITRDLFRVGEAILEQYQNIKAAEGALDFDDLILHTLDLLRGDVPRLNGLDATPWIMYKLDEGLDHILVDEAQDTNPEQWEIIRLLADEFFSGEGAREIARTLFVVGDEKQSIFSFQRAEPKKFDDMHRYFDQKIRDAGYGFRHIDINTSFRSVQAILDSVDIVFSNTDVLGTRYLDHIAKREGQAGIVELWPIYRGTKTDEGDKATGSGWVVPDKIVESQSGALQMALHIADKIKGWLVNGERLESYDRNVQAGDILILVHTRKAFVGQLVRALKTRNVPVSGVDRMILEEQIVVEDLCAAASFALLPEDDLTLACLLKSPLIGMTEEELFKLSYKREGSLWSSLKKLGDAITIEWLEKLIARAAVNKPYEFFSAIVQEKCPADSYSGIRAFRRRLGEEALDPLDEFLNIALSYETTHIAGLQGFLKFLLQDSRQIKRELDEGGGAVRIMTIHGSKGLQAPIVFLPDTVRTSSNTKSENIFWPHRTGLDIPFYISSMSSAPDMANAAREVLDRKANEEYRRLLYVAMTRAEERLYIGGYIGKRGPAKDSKTTYWYEDIRSALEKYPDIQRIESGVKDDEGHDIPVLRLSEERTAEPDNSGKTKATTTPEKYAIPDWATKPAPAEPTPPRPLVPSRPSEPEPAAASPLATSQSYRFKRGNITHKLLQILPDLPLDHRRKAAEIFLKRKNLELSAELQQDIIREIMKILEHPVFGHIFGPGSLAEIPLTGLLGNDNLVSGQIDRLLVTDKEILIIDYKTNRPPPKDLGDVAPAYLRQMQTYAAILRNIYKGRTVRAALLWTDGADMMEIPV